MNKKWCVYIHIAPNEKVYIGITKQNPIKRWRNGKGYPANPYFTNAINKYGWNNIKHEILFSGLTKEQACKKEIELIKKYNSTNRKYGYNQSTGGDCGFSGTQRKMGLKQKEELRQRMIGNKIMVGKHLKEEAKLKISLKNGKRVSQFDKNGNFIKDYISTNKARIETNITHIDDCCRGKRKTAGGFVWKYRKEY